jgi:hypothetical protein
MKKTVLRNCPFKGTDKLSKRVDMVPRVVKRTAGYHILSFPRGLKSRPFFLENYCIALGGGGGLIPGEITTIYPPE